uniref:Uncharacterized protein n=1 Tax=Strongyloides papillosus TaxID=174720 RepID=A0A0N5CIN6_STREA
MKVIIPHVFVDLSSHLCNNVRKDKTVKVEETLVMKRPLMAKSFLRMKRCMKKMSPRRNKRFMMLENVNKCESTKRYKNNTNYGFNQSDMASAFTIIITFKTRTCQSIVAVLEYLTPTSTILCLTNNINWALASKHLYSADMIVISFDHIKHFFDFARSIDFPHINS